MILQGYNNDLFTQEYLQEFMSYNFPKVKVNDIVPFHFIGLAEDLATPGCLFYGKLRFERELALAMEGGGNIYHKVVVPTSDLVLAELQLEYAPEGSYSGASEYWGLVSEAVCTGF